MVSYPGIQKAALAIAYDNGCVNRHEREANALKSLERFLATQPEEILPAIDAWLSGLSAADLDTFCTASADDDERKRELLAASPPFADRLLDDFFNEAL